jgi:hypothetical protein
MPSPLLKHAGKHVQDTDGKVYQVTGTGSLKRLSPKLKGKERRLARQMARMIEVTK